MMTAKDERHLGERPSKRSSLFVFGYGRPTVRSELFGFEKRWPVVG